MKTNQSAFGAKIKVSKLEAARRQLETAIVLFFKGGDSISTHTLASAAFEIICGLNSAQKGQPMIFEMPPHLVKPESKDKLRKQFREAQNFFKHSDKDSEAVLEFNSESTAFVLFDSIEKYRELSGEAPPVLKAFSLWFRGRFPDSFFFTEEERSLASGLIQLCTTTNRAKFFADILPICFGEISCPR